MLVATILRMTPWGAFLPFGISSFGKSRDSTHMSLVPSNTTARLLLAITFSSDGGWPGRNGAQRSTRDLVGCDHGKHPQ